MLHWAESFVVQVWIQYVIYVTLDKSLKYTCYTGLNHLWAPASGYLLWPHTPLLPVLLRPQPGLSSQHRSASGLARIQVHKNNTGQYRYMNYKYKCRTQVQLSLDCHHKTGYQKWDFIQVQVHTGASRGMASWQHSSSVTQPTQHRSGL